jgi:hypothetical protein
MEQRPLRLGDSVDDYCPRERRVTNHVIVAIVEGAIRQTRCSTCDAEHVYKEAREPRRRKRDASASGASLTDAPPLGRIEAPVPSASMAPPAGESLSVPVLSAGSERLDADPVRSAIADHPAGEPAREEFWPAHRQLIRATLPRTDGDPPPRPIPEFTMHQRPGQRAGHVSHRNGWGEGVNGNSVSYPRNGHGGRPHGGQPHGPGKPGRRRHKGKRPR